jgi:hypothetical protein
LGSPKGEHCMSEEASCPLPISLGKDTHSDSDVKKILGLRNIAVVGISRDPAILDLDYTREQEIKLNIPKQDKEIKLSKKYARSILPSTATIAKAQDTYGFRLQKQFQALLQASALDHKRKSVNGSDVQRILELMNWVNFDEKPITGRSP